MRPNTLQVRIALGALVISALATLSLGFYAVYQERAIYRTEVLEGKGRTLALALRVPCLRALAGGRGATQEREGLRALFDALRADSDFRYAIVLDGAGRATAYTDPGGEGSILGGPVNREARKAKELLIQRIEDADGSADILDFAIPLREGGRRIGTLRVGLSTARVQGKIDKFDLIAFTIPIPFLAALAVGIIIWLRRVVVIPVRELSIAIQRVRDGDLTVPSLKRRSDEIGRLNEGFEAMVEDLIEKDVMRGRLLETEKRERAHAELREAHEQLKLTQAQLIQSEKLASLGHLVAGVAHEINNPINFLANALPPLEASIEQLRRRLEASATGGEGGGAKAETRAVLSRIDDTIRLMKIGAERATRIVRDLRTFSHADTGDVAEADLHDNLNRALSLLGFQWRGRVTVHKDYGDIPKVHCTPGQINQVLMNLLTNAFDSIDDSGEIWIETSVSEPPAHRPGAEHEGEADAQTVDEAWVRVSIRDNGRGIARETLDKIFDPFFTTKKVGQGTGLGLSIAHGIIEKHGGRIEVESRLGEGTEFRVLLPVRGAGWEPAEKG